MEQYLGSDESFITAEDVSEEEDDCDSTVGSVNEVKTESRVVEPNVLVTIKGICLHTGRTLFGQFLPGNSWGEVAGYFCDARGRQKLVPVA